MKISLQFTNIIKQIFLDNESTRIVVIEEMTTIESDSYSNNKLIKEEMASFQLKDSSNSSMQKSILM